MASTALAPVLGQPGAQGVDAKGHPVPQQPGRNGGWLKRGNPGQRGTLAMLQAQATVSLRRGLRMAEELMDDPERHPAVRLAAAEFIRRCTGIDRAAPPARAKPASFGVVRAPADELAAQVKPPRPPGVKRKKGPPSEKGLGGTRVAPPGEGPPAVGVDKSSLPANVGKGSTREPGPETS